MARFNTQPITGSITSGGTLAALTQNAFIQLTGTAPYTVTLPSPVLYPGFNQTFYNATSGTVTLTTPANVFTGAGGSGTANVTVPATSTINLVSDGVNYIVVGEDGTSLTATTGAFSSNVTINGASATLSVTPQTVTIAPGGASTIDNVAVGATTRSTGAFTTVAANNAVTFTAGTASSTTGTGSLVVTGGVGVSGNINSGGTVAAVALSGPLTGTIQTAAQPNITSLGTLTGLTVNASNTGTLNLGQTSGGASYVAASLVATASTLYAPVGKLSFRLPTHGVNTDYGLTEQMFIEGTGADSRGAYKISMLQHGGNVGIGTTNPAATLTVKGQTNTAPWLAAERNGSATLQFKIVGAESTGFSASTGTVSPVWTNVIDNNNSNLMLSTFNTGGTGGKIILDGSVGIGHTSPQTRLDVAGTLRFTPNPADTGYTADIFASYNSEHPFQINVKNNGSTAEYFGIYAGAGGANNRVVFPTGNVGIGVTNPQTLLEINQGGAYTQVKHLTLSRTENTRYNAYAGFGDQFGGNTFGWRFGTVNNSTDYPTLYMVNGKVGIATTAEPVTPLQISSAISMASSGSVVDVLSLTDNDGVTSGVTGARIGLTISAQSGIADRRIGIYATANAANFNTPDIAFWASAQGVAYREITRISAANGFLGLGTGANPSAKLHVVVATPTSVAGAPAGTSVLVDSNTNNFVTVRSTADNATNSGILMQDNNVGGYLLFRNNDSSNAAISDRMFLSGYQGVNISYGTSDGTDVTSRTTSASFDSTGVFWEKRKLVYSQDIAAPTGFDANTWFRLSGYEFNNALDTGGTQPGWIIQIRFANLNPSYGYIHWVTAEIPPLSSNTYTGYQGGYTSSHYGNTSVYGSLVFNSTHHTSANANHDIRLKLDSPSNYDVMNLYIWSNTGNSASYPLTYRVWKI